MEVTMVDVIAGAISGYDYEQVRPWLESIRRTNFQGDVILICYEIDGFTLSKLRSEKVGCIEVKKVDNIMVDRFLQAWRFLNDLPEDDVVIWTDVRDVVFQKNPSDWIHKNMFFKDKSIIVGSENLTYADEPWGRNNLLESFGELHFNKIMNWPINCAGVIAGKAKVVTDLFFALYTICKNLPAEIPGGGGPDQAALNVMLSLEPYRSITKFCTTDDDWVCHLGTSMAAIEAGSGGIGQYCRMYGQPALDYFRTKMIGADPKLEDGLVINPLTGAPYCIVHQYDRVPSWKDKMSR
jgi:hypothetical protein